MFKEAPGTTVKDCLKFQERASTPPEIRKYRRSAYLDPGRRFQHPGIADDLKTMELDEKIYGVQSDRGNGTAVDVMSNPPLSTAERLNRLKAERIYKSTIQEPLGQRMNRNVVFPKKFTEGQQPFGIKSKSSVEPAKDIIFPVLDEDQIKGDELYRRSHGSYAPGEQKRRDYIWSFNPDAQVFGVKGGTIAFNGASSNIAEVLKGVPGEEPGLVSTKNIEDFRSTSDILGMSRNLGQGSASRPFDMVYGQTSAAILKSKKVHTAAEVMRGNYNVFQQQPDPDLGKAITPGFRNVSTTVRIVLECVLDQVFII